jgi:hypothetical protein
MQPAGLPKAGALRCDLVSLASAARWPPPSVIAWHYQTPRVRVGTLSLSVYPPWAPLATLQPQTVSAPSSHAIVQATTGHLERRGLTSRRDNGTTGTHRWGGTCARHSRVPSRSHFEQIQVDSPERQTRRQKRSERYFYARGNCPHGFSTDRETACSLGTVIGTLRMASEAKYGSCRGGKLRVAQGSGGPARPSAPLAASSVPAGAAFPRLPVVSQ